MATDPLNSNALQIPAAGLPAAGLPAAGLPAEKLCLAAQALLNVIGVESTLRVAGHIVLQTLEGVAACVGFVNPPDVQPFPLYGCCWCEGAVVDWDHREGQLDGAWIAEAFQTRAPFKRDGVVWQGRETGAVFILPLYHDDAALGVAWVYGDFNGVQVALLSALSHLIAIALHRAQLYERSQVYANELEIYITRRTNDFQQANQRLQESERLFRAIFTALPDPVTLWQLLPDQTLVLQQANLAAIQFFSEYPGDFIGAVAADLLSHAPQIVERFYQVLRDGVPLHEEMLYRDTATTHWLLNDYVRVTDSLLLYLFKDMTARKLTETVLEKQAAELRVQNEELNAFGHMVAHDLKNLLIFTINFAELLLDDDLEGDSQTRLMPEQRRNYLRAIAQYGYKINSIIEALMLLAGIRERKAEIVPLEMEAIVHEVLERLRPQLENAQVILILPAKWPVAYGYAPWIEEVWFNYLSNALKYAGAPPRIELGAEVEVSAEGQASGMVRFWVRDNGQGIPQERQTGLFTPFTRLEPDKQRQGHGLGLSIVRRIIDKLGGKVGVESDVGKGCQFYFTLPCQG